jgi:C4-dicarboxylate-specific signal transduction histidine kinase
MTIRTKILTWQVALVIAVCVVTNFTALRLMTQSLTESQLHKLEVIARDKAGQIASLVQGKAQTAEHIVLGREIAEFARTSDAAALAEYLKKFTADFSSLAYVSEKGVEQLKLIDGRPADPLENVSGTQLFEAALRDRNKVQVALEGNDPSALTLGFAISGQSHAEECEGVIIARAPLADTLAKVCRARIHNTGFLTILDDQGRILSHPDRDKLLQQPLARDEGSQQLLADARHLYTGRGRVTLEGVDGYVAYCPVLSRGWTVIAMLPYEEFMAAPVALRNAAWAVSALVLAASVTASGLMASTVTRGLSKLTAVTSALTAGDLSQRVALRARDEIGALGTAFNRMAHRLQGTIEKLNTEIHDRQHAQAELAHTNDQLRQTQSELVQSEKMGVLGNLAAGVAHEINTPIGAILNVSVDSFEHLRKLAQLELAISHLPAETRRWLSGVLKALPEEPDHAAEPGGPGRRRELEKQLRAADIADARRLAEVIVSCHLPDPANDPNLLRHLSHEPAVEFLEHVAALKSAADISTSSARKVARIVRALSVYSRETRGVVADIHVNDSLEDTLAILRNRLKHDAEIRTYFQKDMPPVRCGPELAQVWTNILNNACDAVELSRGDELGTIEIVTSFTEGRVVVTIANSGPRIPEDILGKIFDPFFTTKPIGKGTGLGLSICAGIVRRAGGTISARNEPDRVIFEVSLPAAGKQGPPSTDALPCPARDDAWAAGNWGPQTSAQTTD